MEEDEEDKKHFNMREIIKNSEADTKKRRKNKLKKKMLEKQKERKNKSLDDFKVRKQRTSDGCLVVIQYCFFISNILYFYRTLCIFLCFQQEK